eukprot:6177861-Pleurochrysis_carterae.AAC.2
MHDLAREHTRFAHIRGASEVFTPAHRDCSLTCGADKLRSPSSSIPSTLTKRAARSNLRLGSNV